MAFSPCFEKYFDDGLSAFDGTCNCETCSKVGGQEDIDASSESSFESKFVFLIRRDKIISSKHVLKTAESDGDEQESSKTLEENNHIAHILLADHL